MATAPTSQSNQPRQFTMGRLRGALKLHRQRQAAAGEDTRTGSQLAEGVATLEPGQARPRPVEEGAGVVSRPRTHKARAGEQTAGARPQPVPTNDQLPPGDLQDAQSAAKHRAGFQDYIARTTAAQEAAPSGEAQRAAPGAVTGKASAGAKLKEGATGSDTGAGRKPTPEPQTADPFRPAGTTPDGQPLYRNAAGDTVYRDADGQLRPYEEGVRDFMGSVDPETGQVEAPAIGEFGAKSLKELEGLAETETAASEKSLKEAETAISGREVETEDLLAEGRERLDTTVQAADDIAAQAKLDASQHPGQVQDALEGIADKYKETTDIDIDRIEGLGREAVGMAMDGKNAAAQAAVSAMHQAMRDAEAKINADPNISAGRKSALLAQLRVNGSMQIATTIGANIKDFTEMQVGAMTDTMNAVGTALSQRSAGLATMGAAEIGAVAGAYETAAKIASGFDELKIQVRSNADSIRFNYDNLTANYRDAKDGTSLALLDAENYVSQLPYDFMTNHFAIGTNILGTDFAMKLQEGGYNNLREALAAGEEWARDATLSQLFMTSVPGLAGTALGVLPVIDDLWEAIFGGK